MFPSFLNRHPSLAVKNAFIYLILLIFSSSLIGYSIYRLSAALILSSSKTQIRNEVRDMAARMTGHFDYIGRDVRFLQNNPLIQEYLKAPESQRKNLADKLGDEFKALLESRPAYFQVRFIGVANNGKELVRVDRDGRQGKILAEAELQEKGDRSYFTETIRQAENSIYFSEIDLNREHGKIDFPYIPTLRIAGPVYKEGRAFGIVIINTDLDALFGDLKKATGLYEDLYIFNNSGYFLVHPDEAECFGFEFGKPPNLKHWFADLNALDPVFTRLPETDSMVSREKEVTEFYTLLHPKTDYKLFIALSAPESAILYPFKSWKKNMMALTFAITFLFLVIAFLWMRRQSRELKKITRSMVKFSEDYSESKLLIRQTDEIGELAKAFSNMAGTIRNNVKELEMSREAAVKANKSKEEFLENMSHEIRNPLQSILGMTNILETNHPRPDQETVIKTIRFSSRQLLSLVNDILDFSKLRIGQIRLQAQDTDLADLLSEITRSHLFLAQSRNISLESHVPPGLKGTLFRVDPLRLSQILNNLLVNAIKFTNPGGKVVLDVEANAGDQAMSLRFTVTDNGTGIPPDELDKIKKRFYSRDATELNTHLSGAGLGLPIVIQLLELFHSELEVESEIQKGSRFSFSLELPVTPPAATSLAGHSSNRGLPPGITQVLCMDDDPQIIYFFRQVFRTLEKDLVCIGEPGELDTLPTGRRFDLIIADFMMSSGNMIRSLPRLARLKSEHGVLIILSGIDVQSRLGESGMQGVDLVLQKPISSSALLAQIQKAWDNAHSPPPWMEDFFNDYDHEEALISHALKILIEEWKTMQGQLIQCLNARDKEAFDQVFHKIITTLRRFRLHHLLKVLEQIQEQFSVSPAEARENTIILSSLMDKTRQEFEYQLHHLPSILTTH
ncbi:MAG TPA: hybrid sensor histidine kinase/response regulator [Saprospiraceae bacterium]|nr:hybrid sensor histidine kinase/response regulator [Saprospiraceae bacterium]HNT21313.1 hybrid sensor histidine kinase/response regulator [Saprospiraceae bacterium]